MPVGRSLIYQASGQASVVGSLVVSMLGTPPTEGLDGAERAIADSRNEARARGGTVSDGPQNGSQGSSIGRLEDAGNSLKAVATPPARMYIQSLDRPEDRVDAQFNPETLRETVSAHWNQWEIPGLSHQPLQYGFTTNDKFEFELVFDAGKGPHPISASAVDDNLLCRDQLLSWQYLRRQDDLGNIGDTQRLLFVWPNFISITCVLTSASFTYEMFNSIGQPTAFRVQLQVEEIRDAILYAEDVQILGSQRSGLKGAQI